MPDFSIEEEFNVPVKFFTNMETDCFMLVMQIEFSDHFQLPFQGLVMSGFIHIDLNFSRLA